MKNQSDDSESSRLAEKPRVIILDDQPTSEDEFGPHERISDTIVDIITQESGGKAIALEGGWGSGKSSVIKLIQHKLRDEKDFHIIQFDAWTHEGDPLRRTYLETVILSLKTKSWINSTAWNETLEEIANRRKVTTTKITPKPTALGKSIAICLLLVPLGTALLGLGIRLLSAQINPNSSNSSTWRLWVLFIFGIIFSISPLLVLFKHGSYIGVKRAWRSLRKLFKKPDLPPLDALDWSFLIGKSVNETRTDSTESPNPTSIEFENYFRRAMVDALEKFPARRIVFVLDNLDRIEPASAISLWSTLQTFLQERDQSASPWYKQLWTIIPYDPVVPARLWKNHESQDDLSKATNSSFLDKSFQIRFSVPPPVLSDWKTYLEGLLCKAFPDSTQNDRYMAYRIYNEWKRENNAHPTPRELKLFVNQIGSILRQWGNEFQFSHIAFFALYCKNTTSAIIQLQEGKMVNQNVKFLLGESLTSSLAGMLFNVKASKGMEFLLADLIGDAISNADHQKLLKLKESQEDGFWPILDLVVARESSLANLLWLGSVSQCLNESQLLAESNIELEEINRNIKRGVMQVKEWVPASQIAANECVSIIQYLKDFTTAEYILKSLKMELEEIDESKISENLFDVILAVSKLIQAAQLHHPDALTSLIFNIPCDTTSWLEAVSKSLSEGLDPIYFEKIRSTTTDEELGKFLAARIKAGISDSAEARAIEELGISINNSALSEISSAIKNRLQAATSVATSEFEMLAGMFLRFRRNSSEILTPVFENLVSNGHIAHHLFAGNNSIRCKTICAYWILQVDPKVSNQPSIGNSSNGYGILNGLLNSPDDSFVADFCNFVSEENLFSEIWFVVEQIGFTITLVAQVIKRLAKSADASKFFTNDVMIEYWKSIETCINSGENDSAFNVLLEKLSLTNKFCDIFYSRSLNFNSNDSSLYWKLLQKNKDNLGFRIWCKKGVEALTKEQWLSDFANEFHTCWLAILLNDLKTEIVLRTGASDALEEHAKKHVDGKLVSDESVAEEWITFIQLLEPSVKKRLLERILRILIEKEGSVSEDFYALYGDLIFTTSVINSDSRVIVDLFSPLVRDKNLEGLKMLSKFAESEVNFLQTLDEQFDHREFETRVRDYLASISDSEVDMLVQNIAEFWNIQPNITAADDNSDESPTDP